MRQRPVSILCLLALFCLLAACSPKQDKKQEFMDHWKQLSQDSQGYSPAPSDLRPEPRVIMRHTEKQEQAASRPPFPSPSSSTPWMWASPCAASRPPPGSTSCSVPA